MQPYRLSAATPGVGRSGDAGFRGVLPYGHKEGPDVGSLLEGQWVIRRHCRLAFRVIVPILQLAGRLRSPRTDDVCLASTALRLRTTLFNRNTVVLMAPTTPAPSHAMATVCVTNLPNGTSEADIRQLFSEYGSIQGVRLYSAEPDRRLQSYSYFDLSSADVERAVAGVDGHLFNGSIIRVSHVLHRPPSTEIATGHPAGVTRHTGDEAPTIRIGNQYQVATVEKAVVPEGGEGADWHRYVLSSGRSQITGLHRGTLEQVIEYAASCVELVNSRSATGKSSRTPAYSKKKVD
jgi:hypothetical protein